MLRKRNILEHFGPEVTHPNEGTGIKLFVAFLNFVHVDGKPFDGVFIPAPSRTGYVLSDLSEWLQNSCSLSNSPASLWRQPRVSSVSCTGYQPIETRQSVSSGLLFRPQKFSPPLSPGRRNMRNIPSFFYLVSKDT